MSQGPTDELRLDVRLIRRRGWISPDELAQELERLPDVSDKASRGDSAAAEAAPGDRGTP